MYILHPRIPGLQTVRFIFFSDDGKYLARVTLHNVCVALCSVLGWQKIYGKKTGWTVGLEVNVRQLSVEIFFFVRP